MAIVRAKVKSALLQWGRTSAGLSVEEAAAKAGLPSWEEAVKNADHEPAPRPCKSLPAAD